MLVAHILAHKKPPKYNIYIYFFQYIKYRKGSLTIKSVSYLHTCYKRRKAERTLAQEVAHVAPQLLFDSRALLWLLLFLHFLQYAGKKRAEQLFG